MSSARKRLQRSRSSKSNVHFLFRRTTKDSLLWTDVDKNTKTTNMVRPNKENGGNVLKLKLTNDVSISPDEFKKGYKIENFFVGKSGALIEEKLNTSVSGKGLCFSINFLFDPARHGALAVGIDITNSVNISIHNSGSGYIVGDKFTISGVKFIKSDAAGTVYGFRGQTKDLTVEVLEVNKF